jgi:hypothetical protein
MMVILVQIFQQATGAMTASRQIQDLDLSLRQLDQRIKQDLIGSTARMTPPLDPSLKLGYFEYFEGAFADLQGEDTDDYIAFTTKAPEGQVFTGRFFVPNPPTGQPNAGHAANLAVQPVTVTSQLAEVIYFLRNGNLYRRVFLIAPERQSSLSTATANKFPALIPGAVVSWLGVNDISARPSPTGAGTILLNDLGTLTNRENRRFSPRFRSDFFQTGAFGNPPDGIDDDFNSDDIPDFYPTLYPNVFLAQNGLGYPLVNEIPYPTNANSRNLTSYNVNPFPYIFPGMYSQPETMAPYSQLTGWIHSLDPSHTTYVIPNASSSTGLPSTPYPYTGNHAPLATGDLPVLTPNTAAGSGQLQTWWGFPTWRETLSPFWGDPAIGMTLGNAPTQVKGLVPIPPNVIPGLTYSGYLPPVAKAVPPYTPQFASDGAGNAVLTGPNAGFGQYVPSPTNPVQGVWDDDLICANVRSFDIKAFDPAAPLYGGAAVGYQDLGYGLQTAPALNLGVSTPIGLWDSTSQPQGFGHAGRMPPLVNDVRLNPARPFLAGGTYNNIGDNGSNNIPVIRLTRVWDSWSTDYSNAPSTDVFFNGYPGQGNGMPIYPSYPAPYTSPLRGIQIQIRVNDPRGEYLKTLTIRHDFTDKL